MLFSRDPIQFPRTWVFSEDDPMEIEFLPFLIFAQVALDHERLHESSLLVEAMGWLLVKHQSRYRVRYSCRSGTLFRHCLEFRPAQRQLRVFPTGSSAVLQRALQVLGILHHTRFEDFWEEVRGRDLGRSWVFSSRLVDEPPSSPLWREALREFHPRQG